jgi:cytochrome oxidase assembly protein ShyY1
MNNILMTIIGGMFAILIAVASWWITRAEKKFEVVDQLQFRSVYLYGNIPAAPVSAPKAHK